MSVKIRLQRHGRKKAPFYHIVIADSRSPRDGRFIEKIGTYNPMTKPATIDIDRDKAFEWLQKGAQPTDTVHAILRFKGVMYRKHLTRGVTKGSLTAEQAMEKYTAWIDVKEKKISDTVAKTAADKKVFAESIFGKPKPKAVVIPEVVEEPVAEVIEEAVVEVTPEPVVEAVVEPVVEVTPEPVVEAIAEPIVEVAPEPVVEEVVAAEPIAEAVVEPTAEVVAEPVVEATTDETPAAE